MQTPSASEGSLVVSHEFCQWNDEFTSAAERSCRRPKICANGIHISESYGGAVPWRHLKTVRKSLHLILSGTSSQCKSYNDIDVIT